MALGPLIGYVLTAVTLPKQSPGGPANDTRLLDFRPALTRPQAVAYMAAYAIHKAESSAMRAWAVALLVFSQHQQPSEMVGADWSPTIIAMIANLLGLPALFGFTGAFLGPLLFGSVLDLGGGAATQQGWIIAFITFTAVAGLGAIVLLTLAAPSQQKVPLS